MAESCRRWDGHFRRKVKPASAAALRDQEAWTAEKYRRFDRHEPMPPDWRPP